MKGQVGEGALHKNITCAVSPLGGPLRISAFSAVNGYFQRGARRGPQRKQTIFHFLCKAWGGGKRSAPPPACGEAGTLPLPDLFYVRGSKVLRAESS